MDYFHAILTSASPSARLHGIHKGLLKISDFLKLRILLVGVKSEVARYLAPPPVEVVEHPCRCVAVRGVAALIAEHRVVGVRVFLEKPIALVKFRRIPILRAHALLE